MNCDGNCCAWFSLRLEADACQLLGADCKETKIYELEIRGTSVLHGDGHLGQPNGICIPRVVRGQRQRAVCANPWNWFGTDSTCNHETTP